MEANGHQEWLARNRDLAGRSTAPWVRRVGLLVLVALVVAALLNAFGQRTTKSSASAPAASLTVDAPKRVRGGVIFQGRFDVRATHEIKQPLLVLDPGWIQGLTQNTSAPEPAEERTDNGRLVLEYDTIPAGRKLSVWLQYQVNPTHVGKTEADVELWDGSTRLLHLDRSLTSFP
jgi:hypothetical protein